MKVQYGLETKVYIFASHVRIFFTIFILNEFQQRVLFFILIIWFNYLIFWILELHTKEQSGTDPPLSSYRKN